MSDHKKKSTRARRPAEEVGIRELKADASRIVRRVKETGATYVVTHRGQAAAVILPLDSAGRAPDADDAPGAWQEFVEAGHRLARGFRRGVSGVDQLSKSRR